MVYVDIIYNKNVLYIANINLDNKSIFKINYIISKYSIDTIVIILTKDKKTEEYYIRNLFKKNAIVKYF